MANEMTSVFHEATANDLGRIRQYVRETAVSCQGEPSAVEELVIAVNEAAANIMRHGCKNQPGEIKVIIVCSGQSIQVTLVDNCVGFDPTIVPSPDTSQPLEERPFGGLGIHMMRTFCDKLSYRRNAQGENELTLLKTFS